MQNKFLVSELVLAENASVDEVEGLIENKINASFKRIWTRKYRASEKCCK